ncbi:MAG: HAD-IA family hydrolase [Burkholderiaceae bacterium]
MTTNIVFDFGAVLFTWRPHRLMAAHFPARAGTDAAARALSAAIFHHEDWQAFDRGALELGEVVERTRVRLDLPQAGLQDLMAGIPAHLSPIPETVALLERLRRRRQANADVRLFFLSNMPAPFARKLERRHAFLDWFDGGVFSGDVHRAKPQPEIFELLSARHALDPDRTVFLDDMDVNVQAARAHGWHAHQFESAAQIEPQLMRHLP